MWGGVGIHSALILNVKVQRFFWQCCCFLCTQRHGPILADDELTTVRKNLETISVDVSSDLVSSLV